MGAMSARLHHATLRTFYDHLIAAGKNHHEAMAGLLAETDSS
jgi:hypothetical protein